ncbi:MAG TPA: DUF3570 domain-containing protein [Chitinophagaceae bacterium]
MRKITFAALACFFQVLAAFSQETKDTVYKSRKLKTEEINFVSGYYHQNGDHSAVTGGIGTEKLTDLSNTIEVKLVRSDRRNNDHSLNIELGIDHYSSASSDKIDPSTISSPSHADTRIYPSVGYTIKNQHNFSIGLTGSASNEFDYHSWGAGLNIGKSSPDNNTDFNLKLQAYWDSWKLIYPIELRPPGYGTGGEDGGPVIWTPRNSYSASFSFSRVINARMQVSLLLDLITQNGMLATNYQRVYFDNNTAKPELLPDSRFKLPVGIRFNWFLPGEVILRSYYRYYSDNWGLKAHTAELEAPVKLSPFFSISPFYRFYWQDQADYFAPYRQHRPGDVFYTSDYDLSRFSSHYFGSSFRWVPANGVFHIGKWNSLELRYGHYMRSNDLNSDMITMALKFK